MSFLPGPERRGLFEVLREKLRKVEFKRGALGFFPFIIRESRPFEGLGYFLVEDHPPGAFFVDEDFESLEFISGEGEKGK